MPKSATVTARTEDVAPRRGRGAPPGEAHGLSVLSETKVRLIRRLRKLDLSPAKIAIVFDCSESTIRAVLTGKTWGHVTD